MRRSSIAIPGSGMLSDPVAMTIAPALDLLAVSSIAIRPWCRDPGFSLQPIDLVLAEQELDAARQGADDLVLARHHRGKIEPDLADPDAVLGQASPRLGEFLRGLQQCLRRDAADIETGAAERRPRNRRRPCASRAGRRGSPRHSRPARRRSRQHRSARASSPQSGDRTLRPATSGHGPGFAMRFMITDRTGGARGPRRIP